MNRILSLTSIIIGLSFSLSGNVDAAEKDLNKERAKFAYEMFLESKSLIKQKKYDQAEKNLLKITNFLEPTSLTWPIILDAALEKNAISLSKALDAWKVRNFEQALYYIEEFRVGFYIDRNIQGDPETIGRPGLLKTRGQEAVDKHLRRPEKLEKEITRIKKNIKNSTGR